MISIFRTKLRKMLHLAVWYCTHLLQNNDLVIVLVQLKKKPGACLPAVGRGPDKIRCQRLRVRFVYVEWTRVSTHSSCSPHCCHPRTMTHTDTNLFMFFFLSGWPDIKNLIKSTMRFYKNFVQIFGCAPTNKNEHQPPLNISINCLGDYYCCYDVECLLVGL